MSIDHACQFILLHHSTFIIHVNSYCHTTSLSSCMSIHTITPHCYTVTLYHLHVNLYCYTIPLSSFVSIHTLTPYHFYHVYHIILLQHITFIMHVNSYCYIIPLSSCMSIHTVTPYHFLSAHIILHLTESYQLYVSGYYLLLNCLIY